MDGVQIGWKLRQLRRRADLTLKEAGQASGLSESFLSQLERGKTNASLGSLQRLASVLGATVSDLFEAPESAGEFRVLRSENRPSLNFGTRGKKYLLTPSHTKHLEIFAVVFEPGGETGPEQYTHGDSEEFIVVSSGEFRVEIGSNAAMLGPGDSVLFRSSVPHRVVNGGDVTGHLLWIMSPPSF